jgi:hypothetical protein
MVSSRARVLGLLTVSRFELRTCTIHLMEPSS